MSAPNELGQAASPYLLQHAKNPVHWRMWGAAALKEAQAQNKPILLSVGYAACHWCHVMAHESFEDEATAAVMNELYREHQGRSRGAPRYRSYLYDGFARFRRTRRLADDHVLDAKRRTLLGRHLFSQGCAIWPAFVRKRVEDRCAKPSAPSPARIAQNTKLHPRRAIAKGRARRRRRGNSRAAAIRSRRKSPGS